MYAYWEGIVNIREKIQSQMIWVSQCDNGDDGYFGVERKDRIERFQITVYTFIFILYTKLYIKIYIIIN